MLYAAIHDNRSFTGKHISPGTAYHGSSSLLTSQYTLSALASMYVPADDISVNSSRL